ncbi:hypothetical protein B566_EDAN011029 [Ephemera danica]|nr:hypothetical protein B566_EDAN011029 [Ephemera danica]
MGCLDAPSTVKRGSVSCSRGKLDNVTMPICTKNNSSTFMMNDKYVTIPTAVLGCLLFICIIYVTVKKIQKHRMPLLRAADDEEVLYDEIDLRFAVEPPVPEPPPRVHDGHGYLLVKEPYQYDVVGEEKALEKWIKPIAEVSDDVEQDDVNQDPLSHNAEVPENEDPILHNPEEPEDEDPMLHKPEVPKDENPMLLKPEMPKDVDEKPECPQLEKSEYVDQNKLHRYKTEMPNRPKLPDYVDQNDLEQCQAKISHKPKVFEDVEQNEDKVICSLEESVNVDEPEFQESKYVDHNDLHRYKVKMPYRPKLPDYVDENDFEQR